MPDYNFMPCSLLERRVRIPVVATTKKILRDDVIIAATGESLRVGVEITHETRFLKVPLVMSGPQVPLNDGL